MVVIAIHPHPSREHLLKSDQQQIAANCFLHTLFCCQEEEEEEEDAWENNAFSDCIVLVPLPLFSLIRRGVCFVFIFLLCVFTATILTFFLLVSITGQDKHLNFFL